MLRIKKPYQIYLIVSILFSLSVFFVKLGKSHLIEYDEAIYGLVAKNIIKTGDVFTLHWKLEQPWFDKGPLYLWLTALSLKVFGFNAFAVRFWSALFGFLSSLTVFFIGKKLYNYRVGFSASIILSSTVGYLYYARNGMLDVPNAFFNTASFYFLCLSLDDKKYLRMAAIFLGLGFLNRGFLSFFGLSAFLIFAFLRKRLKEFKPKDLAGLAMIFVLINLPWHAVETYRHGFNFWEVYLGHQTFLRFTQTIEGKAAPFFWYITVARTHLRFWYPGLILALIYISIKSFRRESSYFLLLLWWSSVFVGFTVARSKLIWYIMPLYPPSSLVIARFFYDLLEKFKWERLLPILVLAGGVIFNFQARDRILPPDFTYDQVKLIDYKNNLDPQADLLAINYSFSVSQFYSVGKVVPIPLPETKGFFDSLGYRYGIITADDLSSLKYKDNYQVLYSSGSGVLISKK